MKKILTLEDGTDKPSRNVGKGYRSTLRNTSEERSSFCDSLTLIESKQKSKNIPLQAWTDTEDSRRLRLPDF
jgi:hypothetical protein